MLHPRKDNGIGALIALVVLLSVLSGDEVKLFSHPLVYPIVGVDIPKQAFYKRSFASTMKSLFGENLLLFVKLKRSVLGKRMTAPLESHHHHSFAKKYEKAINGCQKYIHIKLPQGDNFQFGSYMATMIVRF